MARRHHEPHHGFTTFPSHRTLTAHQRHVPHHGFTAFPSRRGHDRLGFGFHRDRDHRHGLGPGPGVKHIGRGGFRRACQRVVDPDRVDLGLDLGRGDIVCFARDGSPFGLADDAFFGRHR